MAALHHNVTHETSHAEWDFPQTYTHAQTFQPKIISPSSWFFLLLLLLFPFSFWINLALPAEWHRSLLSICLWFSWQWHFMRHGWSGQVQKDFMTLRNGIATGVHRWVMRMDFIALWAGAGRRACGLCFLPALPHPSTVMRSFKVKRLTLPWSAPVMFYSSPLFPRSPRYTCDVVPWMQRDLRSVLKH